MSEYIDKFDSSVNNVMDKLRSNEYVESTLILVLVLYAGLAAPRLPYSIAKLFGNVFFQLVFLALIAYYFNKNPTLAIVAAVAFMVSVITLNKITQSQILEEKFEKFADLNAKPQFDSDLVEINMNDIENGYINYVPVSALTRLESNNKATDMNDPVNKARRFDENTGSAGCSNQIRTSYDPNQEQKSANCMFYPQYENLPTDTYEQRYNDYSVKGFESSDLNVGTY